MNPSQETCLIFVDSFGGKDIYQETLSVIDNVYYECRWALSRAHFFMQFLLSLFSMQIEKEGLAAMKNVIT